MLETRLINNCSLIQSCVHDIQRKFVYHNRMETSPILDPANCKKLKVLRTLAWHKYSAEQKFGLHKVQLSEGMVTMVGSSSGMVHCVKAAMQRNLI